MLAAALAAAAAAAALETGGGKETGKEGKAKEGSKDKGKDDKEVRGSTRPFFCLTPSLLPDAFALPNAPCALPLHSRPIGRT